MNRGHRNMGGVRKRVRRQDAHSHDRLRQHFGSFRGLKQVFADHWLRTKYDQVPLPPLGPKGADRITILEDRGKLGT